MASGWDWTGTPSPAGSELVGHVGETAGYRGYMFRLPAQRIDLVMVTTAPADPMPVRAAAIRLLLAEGR